MSFFLNKESLIDLSAGWCSGAAAVICCQPVDTILTRRQAGSKLIGGLGTAVSASAASSTRTLIAQVGIVKLWRGALPMIGAVPFQNALLMAGYGLGKRYGQPSDTSTHDNDNNNNHNQYWGIFVGGCTGGVLQSFLMSPIELVKVQLQINLLGTPAASVAAIASAPSTATTATTTSISSMASIWKGLGATLLRDGIPHGVWFVSYEMSKEYLSGLLVQERPSSDCNSSSSSSSSSSSEGGYHKSLTVPLLSGAFAATAAWGVGYPADLIKTRIQAGSMDQTIWGTAKELMLEPGGLYRGFGLKLLRSVPASMIGFVVYEHVAQRLSQSM